MYHILELPCLLASGQPSQQAVSFKAGWSQGLVLVFFTWLPSRAVSLAESVEQGLLFPAGSPLHMLPLPLGPGIYFLLRPLQAWEWQCPFPLPMTLYFPQKLPIPL